MSRQTFRRYILKCPLRALRLPYIALNTSFVFLTWMIGGYFRERAVVKTD
jgi:hypothetical protein